MNVAWIACFQLLSIAATKLNLPEKVREELHYPAGQPAILEPPTTPSQLFARFDSHHTARAAKARDERPNNYTPCYLARAPRINVAHDTKPINSTSEAGSGTPAAPKPLPLPGGLPKLARQVSYPPGVPPKLAGSFRHIT